MTSSPDPKPEDLRCAEYVLGVLDADTRTTLEREMAADPHMAAEVARWQRYLSPLVEDIPAIPPPDLVWSRIEADISARATSVPHSAPAARNTGWNSLALWRWFAAGATAVAVAFIIAFVTVVPGTPSTPAVTSAASYMASTIVQKGGRVEWTATMDLKNARMIVVPARPQALPATRAPELWLIPAGRKPIAVGMIATQAPITLTLSPTLVAELGPTAAFAVSVEPTGGSPTGQPTGPVIAEGHIGAVNQPPALRDRTS
ncbi:MAG TPA: anti-sigma factor [Nevskiaceae bacterium]|nr:anti-sigma factor [Nevskiaceae bacterium]